VTTIWVGRPGFDSSRAGFFSSPQRPDRRWGPLSLFRMGTGVLSSGMKRAVSQASQSSLSGSEVKNTLSYTSTPPYVCKAWCLVKHQGQLCLNVKGRTVIERIFSQSDENICTH
jgi:hypothetical protein